MAATDTPTILVVDDDPDIRTIGRLSLANVGGMDVTVVGSGLEGIDQARSAKPDVILIATGSEVSICLEARKVLAEDGLKVRVVSMPCWELFTAQPVQYQEGVLPPSITARVGVEMGVRLGWDQFLGPKGEFIGMEGFGASAPAGTLAKHFGFTVENVVAKAKETLTR